jgi:carboxymethylenebutenolidase
MTNEQNYVSLSVADGSTMFAYTAIPQGQGPFPGLILFQEAFGVNHHIRDLAERFAGQGYVVIVPELFHRTAPKGFEGSYSDFASVAPHMEAIKDEQLEQDVRASFDWLQNNPLVKKDRIACTGYCMGGRVSFLANSILPLKAAISYYGGRIAPALIHRAPSLHAPMLFFWGGLDKHIPQEQITTVVDALKAAGKDCINVEISYADHGFFCDERGAYNPKAAAEAWALTLAFFDQNVGK